LLIPYKEHVIEDFLLWKKSGLKTALVTLVEAKPSGPRNPGAQMAINEKGQAVGYFSGGCVEAALVTETLNAFQKNQNQWILYGKDSPYMDIVLPCGNSQNAFIDVHLNETTAAKIISAERQRKTVHLVVEDEPYKTFVSPQIPTITRGFICSYTPRPRLVIAGKGPLVLLLVSLAKEAEIDTIVCSHDDHFSHLSEKKGATLLKNSQNTSQLAQNLDPWSGLVTLFHEHHLELPYLKTALEHNCFYVGALGSRITHKKRIKELTLAGISQNTINSIHAPVGMNLGSKSLSHVAVAIIAQFLYHWNQNALDTHKLTYVKPTL
jgi:xanthine dehydrogenase accessory factor